MFTIHPKETRYNQPGFAKAQLVFAFLNDLSFIALLFHQDIKNKEIPTDISLLLINLRCRIPFLNIHHSSFYDQ